MVFLSLPFALSLPLRVLSKRLLSRKIEIKGGKAEVCGMVWKVQ